MPSVIPHKVRDGGIGGKLPNITYIFPRSRVLGDLEPLWFCDVDFLGGPFGEGVEGFIGKLLVEGKAHCFKKGQAIFNVVDCVVCNFWQRVLHMV